MIKMLELERPRLFDSGRWHDRLLEREIPRPDRIALFLPSGNGLRYSNLIAAAEELGLGHDILKRITGPEVEIGETPLERARHKIMHGLTDFIGQGYFDRHPADLTLIVAVDSRNKYNGGYRDKAMTFDYWYGQFREEWERVATDDLRVIDETGYAGMAIFGNRFYYAERTSKVTPKPLSVGIIRREFEPARFELANGNAHGLNSKRLIDRRELKILRLNGAVLFGEEAVQAVYGAEKQQFEEILVSLLAQIGIS